MLINGVSFIVATIGRPSLADTLASIELWPDDEVIVIGNVETRTEGQIRYIRCPPGHDWGSTERNIATPLARGRYLSHIDDDDVYAPGARAAMAAAMMETPNLLTIFRMQYANGNTLWQKPIMLKGNIGTPMIFMPNDPQKMGQWGEHMDCGDFYFLQTMRWEPDDIVWDTTVIALLERPHQ
jgi:Glycosyl transferase family 2